MNIILNLIKLGLEKPYLEIGLGSMDHVIDVMLDENWALAGPKETTETYGFVSLTQYPRDFN